MQGGKLSIDSNGDPLNANKISILQFLKKKI